MIHLLVFGLCIASNFFAAAKGYTIKTNTGNHHIIVGYSVSLFLFIPMMVYLPQSHHLFSIKTNPLNSQAKQLMPFAFILSLLFLSLLIIFQNNIKRTIYQNFHFHFQTELNQILTVDNYETATYPGQNRIVINCMLMGALFLNNLLYAYYMELSQLHFFLYWALSFVLHATFGFINKWSNISEVTHRLIQLVVNLGILLGYLLSFLVNISIVAPILICIVCAVMIQSSALIAFPHLIGQKTGLKQSKRIFIGISLSWVSILAYIIFKQTVINQT